MLSPDLEPCENAIRCEVLARAFIRAAPEAIVAIRKAPGNLGSGAVPAALLKHADDQTVVGLASVLEAVRTGSVPESQLSACGVIAAPRLLGRAAFETSFPQFLNEGAWGVSPHLISQNSLHALSGTISQVLKAQALNLGVGGSSGDALDAFLAAATFLAEQPNRVAWVVLTGWNVLSGDQPLSSHRVCDALALALTPCVGTTTHASIRIAPGLAIGDAIIGQVSPRPLDLSRLSDAIGASRTADAPTAAVSKNATPRWRLDAPHRDATAPSPHQGPSIGASREPRRESQA